jgi:Ala-tRNA(Pro) deacylase
MDRCLGIQPGSVSPLGLMNDMKSEELTKEHFPNGHRVKLFLDAELRTSERVSFHPCDNTASVVITNADFMRFLEIWGGEYEWIDVTPGS